MSETESQSDHIVALARELLDDVELSRTSVESIVLKASRLARLLGDEELIRWLYFERFGYITGDPISLKYVAMTERWIDSSKGIAFWRPAAQQEYALNGFDARLEVTKKFTPSGDFSMLQLNQQESKISKLSNEYVQIGRIVSSVKALVQDFVSQTLHERLFSGHAETIFERFKQEVDTLLAARAGDALSKIPSIFDRLAEGEQEAVSQALLTCRRVIDNFADAIYPPRNGTDTLGSKEVDVGPNRPKNRFRIYVDGRVSSKSRKEKILKIFGLVYDRVSTGVHDDVDVNEAKAIVLQTYLLLGEVLSLGNPPELHVDSVVPARQ